MMMMTLVLNQWANIAEANRKRPRKSQEKKDRKRKKNAHGNQIHLANSILAGERALCCWFCRWLSTQQQQASNKQPKKTHTTNMSQRQRKKSILTTNENERKKIVAHNWRVHHHNVDRGEKGIQCYMVWPKIDSLLYYLPVNLIAKCSINVFIQFFSLLLYCFPSLSLSFSMLLIQFRLVFGGREKERWTNIRCICCCWHSGSLCVHSFTFNAFFA